MSPKIIFIHCSLKNGLYVYNVYELLNSVDGIHTLLPNRHLFFLQLATWL
jgi:hypothetical protein